MKATYELSGTPADPHTNEFITPDPENIQDPIASQRQDDDQELLPDEEDDDYEETYGDLEDGHNDIPTPESDQGVANLE